MRVTRLYHPAKLDCGKTVTLDAAASRHLIRVLRTRTGSNVTLFDGDGFDYHCKTVDADPKRTRLHVQSRIQLNNESSLYTTLVQGISRNERMDTTIQKAVELGVNRVIPVLCERSNYRVASDRASKKIDHWKRVAISACEQSGRSRIPEITDIMPVHDIGNILDKDASKFVLNPYADISFSDLSAQPHRIELVVGPEGGLSGEEIASLEEHGFMSVQFGPRILRTETTGPAALCAIQVLWGDI